MSLPIHTNDHPFTTDQDISSTAFWRQTFRERDETFAWLRANAPVSWHPPLRDERTPDAFGQRGFWAVTRSADIRDVSLDNTTYSSALGGTTFRPSARGSGLNGSFLEMDPPDHTRYRKIFSAAFTPKAVSRLQQQIRDRAQRIVERVIGAGDIDFVTEVAAKLPMMTVADLIGIPESQVEAFTRAGDNLVSMGHTDVMPDGTTLEEFAIEQVTVLAGLGLELIEHRRAHPADDLATAIAETRFDGRPLTVEEIASIMALLSVAGNDTTKQTTSWTALALAQHPDQKAWLTEDLDGRIGPAIEEFVRYASPVIEFARTATTDTELAGQQITAGDKVVLFYCSGNRDESVFDDPYAFDVRRPSMRHVGFGGGGVHFCLGNHIAKAQLRALYTEILTKLPGLEVTGEPEYLTSEFINGIRHLPVRV
ncbi:cytochrome P450 [Nonomuraea antimicrobica]|uniref:Cytochrome P450 n=1 Tax=Nonomuraea antimicrobica TaxID=561173 RepID=A0ABP7BQV0_9ACTN